jgi:hypothetical protein
VIPHRRTPRALATLAAVAGAAASAHAADWVVRPVRLGEGSPGPIRNVDVMIRGTDVAVGYTVGGAPAVHLSTLPAGASFFDHQSSAGPISPLASASFAVDSAGFIHYAYRGTGGLRVGTETAGWGLGMLEGPHTSGQAYTIRTPLPLVDVDSRGVPSLLATDLAGNRVLSRFDVPSGTWFDLTLPAPPIPSVAGPYQSSLAFTRDDRAVVSYINLATPTTLVTAIHDDALEWRTFTRAVIDPNSAVRGVSVTALPDGDIAVAYNAPDGLRVDTFDGGDWSSELVSGVRSHLLPNSLTVDADGRLAIAYAPRATNVTVPLHVARRSDTGWADETLPVSGWYGSLTFDAANNPYVGVFNGLDVLLAGTTIAALPQADLGLDGSVTSDDIPALTQAILHPATFLSTRPDLTTADLVAIADRDGDLRLTTNDARLFVDSLAATPLPGLPDRTSGYLALDQADLDPATGSGAGNFFGTLLSTGAPYSPGDSRLDITGGPDGAPDGRIDSAEADLLVTALTPAPAPVGVAFEATLSDPRLDFNLDGSVDAADLRFLIHDLLETTEGDADLDGTIDADDFALVDRGHARQLPGWSAGDFNADGAVTTADYLFLDAAFAAQSGGTLSTAFLSMRETQFGADYLSSLVTSIPEPSIVACPALLLGLMRRRHHR